MATFSTTVTLTERNRFDLGFEPGLPELVIDTDVLVVLSFGESPELGLITVEIIGENMQAEVPRGQVNQVRILGGETLLIDYQGVNARLPPLLDQLTAPGALTDLGYQLLLLQGPDDMQGSDGADEMSGFNSTDTLRGGNGEDTLFGAGDRDLIEGGQGRDRIFGGDGDDTLLGGADGDRIFGGEGADLIDGEGGGDNIRSGAGDDTVSGAGGNDRIVGGAGNDLIFGGDGRDSVSGANGDDRVFGGDDDDQVEGGRGNDTLDGGAGADAIDGGDGFDFVSYESAEAKVLVDLSGRIAGRGDAAGDTFTNIEGVIGSRFGDNLRGDAGGDVIRGGNASDRIFGLGGNDTIDGETGSDVIFGNRGVDEMTGGAGRDRFVFTDTTDSGVGAGQRDIITDFSTEENDRIELGRIDADATAGRNQAFTFIGDAAFSAAGQLRADQSSGISTIVQGDIDGDGQADFEIELTGLVDLTAANFLL